MLQPERERVSTRADSRATCWIQQGKDERDFKKIGFNESYSGNGIEAETPVSADT